MTYQTSKGEVIQSDLTDQQAVEIVEASRPTGFALDLCVSFRRGKLSDKQRPWLHKIALERSRPTPTIQILPKAGVILHLLQFASQKLKYPKITLDQEGQELRLQLAGEHSKYRGDVMITDGKPFGENVWYGRINPDGQFIPSRAATPWVMETLVAFTDDPVGFAGRYGALTGTCCFCGRTLSTVESTSVGYGPICAENYGLPWG